MFGLSGFKLIFTLAVAALVWFVFKYIGRLAEVKAEKAAGRRDADARPRSGPGRVGPDSGASVDLQRCAACGTFVSGRQGACGRADCPYS